MLAQHLPHGLVAGIAGYAVQQTTPDSGSGANLGAFKRRVIGLGPLAGITVPTFRTPISFSFQVRFRICSAESFDGR